MVGTNALDRAGRGFDSQCEHVLCERCARIYARNIRKCAQLLATIAQMYPFVEREETEEELLINLIDLTKY